MNRGLALEQLRTGNARERLEGARYLRRVAEPSDISVLQSALRNEPVVWVRAALEELVDALAGNKRTSERPALGDEDALLSEVYMTAVRETTLRLIHELRPIVGKARLFGQEEFEHFQTTRTSGELDSLVAALAAVEQLGRAASAPVLGDVDLSAILVHVAASCAAEHQVVPELAGPHMALVRSDRGLIELVVRNAITNAIEAVEGFRPGGRVIVDWGTTDRDYWVAVLDDGPGLTGTQSQLFEIGLSTKRGHLGFGLSTARVAAASLGSGTVTLRPRSEGGARFELRVPTDLSR